MQCIFNIKQKLTIFALGISGESLVLRTIKRNLQDSTV